MVWKEIYYINLYFNEYSKNTSQVYGHITDICLNDIWKKYDYSGRLHHFNEKEMMEKYNVLQNIDPKQYRSLIHIITNEKLNNIGKDKFALSKKWFNSHQEDDTLKILSNNVVNYFINIMSAKSKNCMWTTYAESKNEIKGKGFRRGFIGLDDFNFVSDDRIYLAYLCNNFYPQSYTNRTLPENTYALIELLHFISNSAIRNGKEVWIYIPSLRMRTLLKKWMKEYCIEE